MKCIFIILVAIVSLANQALPAEARPKRASDVEDSLAPSVSATNALDKEYEAIMEADDAAQAEVDEWIRQYEEFEAKGAGGDTAALNRRIRERFEPIKKLYQEFLQKHPEHVRARIAYASFLDDVESEEAAKVQLERVLEIDTNSAAAYNNLANIYGHTGNVKKAFDYYEKAIKLRPKESVYYHNLGTTVYLFRKDAREHYGIDEQKVFDKAFSLYSNALRLDPTNFPLASDVAQTYYGVKPLRMDEAMKAWTNALNLAHDSIEREGIYVHFARLKMLDGQYQAARDQLTNVTDKMYKDLKERLLKSIDAREKESTETNKPSVKVE